MKCVAFGTAAIGFALCIVLSTTVLKFVWRLYIEFVLKPKGGDVLL